MSDWKALTGSRLALRVSAGATTTVAMEGELDVSATDALLDRIELELARSPDEVVLDLSRLSFIDSTGLRTLLQARDICDKHGSRLLIVEGRGHVARVFGLTGLDSVLPVVGQAPNLAEAAE